MRLCFNFSQSLMAVASVSKIFFCCCCFSSFSLFVFLLFFIGYSFISKRITKHQQYNFFFVVFFFCKSLCDIICLCMVCVPKFRDKLIMGNCFKLQYFSREYRLGYICVTYCDPLGTKFRF